MYVCFYSKQTTYDHKNEMLERAGCVTKLIPGPKGWLLGKYRD